MGLTMPTKNATDHTSPRVTPTNKETEVATRKLEKIMNNDNDNDPKIISITKVTSPISVEMNEYRYELDEDLGESQNNESVDTRPPSVGGHATPGLQQDFQVSSSDSYSSDSSSDDTEEQRTRKACFRAIFTIEDVGSTHTEIRMRTPKLYDCNQQ